jgi:hypothetical protein
METFSIAGVDQTGVECILANPLPRADFGNLVGAPVSFGKKVVGQIVRVYRDATGPWVCKLALNDMNALRLSATGCISSVNVGADGVELSDRPSDHGKTFDYTKADGSRIAKRFVGLSEFERDNALLKTHVSKLPAALRKNEEFALLTKGFDWPGKPINYRLCRKPKTNANDPASERWPNGSQPIGVAREVIPNRNAR